MATPATKRAQQLPGWLHDLLERHLEQQVELPVLSDAAARVLALCEDEKSDARALEQVLERDPSLAAHVLRIANSAAYAPKEPIVSLQQAVSRLGLPAIRAIALGISLHSRVFALPGHQARVQSIWTHCVVTAVFARETARKLRRNVEAAFLNGLLHDVGRPVVLQSTVDALAHRTKVPLPTALLETAMDEFHDEVGARLVESWKFADWTIAAVEHHHHPERAAAHADEARVVYLADRLAHWALDEEPTAGALAIDDPECERLGLYPEDVEALRAHRGKALEFAEAFQ